jgi:hypothetical protein
MQRSFQAYRRIVTMVLALKEIEFGNELVAKMKDEKDRKSMTKLQLET